MRLRIILLAASILAATAALCPGARAEDAEPAVLDFSHSSRFVEIKPYIGMGASSLLQNYAKVIPGLSEMQMSPGVMTRAGIDVGFQLMKSLALCTGMAYDFNNNRYAMSIIDENTGSINSIYVRNRFHELYFPVYASLRMYLGSRMSWSVDLGGYYAIGLGGTMKATGYTSGHNTIGQPIVTMMTHDSKYFKAGHSSSLVNGIKDRDSGVRIASGLTYNSRFSLGLVFDLSVPNLAINHDVLRAEYRNYNVTFEIGCYF